MRLHTELGPPFRDYGATPYLMAVVESAADEMNPTNVASYLYGVAKLYSRYYHDNPVLHNDDNDIVHTRIAIAKAVVRVLRNGFAILGIPFLEKM